MNERLGAGKRARWSVLLGALLIPLLASAATDSVEFDVDDPPSPDRQLAEHLRGGAKLVVESDYLDDADLDSTVDDRRWSIDPELEVVLAYAPDPDLQLITELEWQRRYWFDHPDGRGAEDTVLELKEFYLLTRQFAPGWSAQLGRQRFRDRREWLYDERLDGARLVYRQQRWGLMLAVTREAAFQRDLLNHDQADKVDSYELRWRHLINGDSDLDLYWLRRDSHEADDADLDYFGIHSSGKLASGQRYWIDGALIDGERRQRDVRAVGVDFGWNYRFDGERRHNFTLAFAYGGGDNSNSGRDGTFRQTGLQDNNARLQGLTKVKYYGELLDPELSNLQIATLGWGMRPTSDSSIDLLYHQYRQVEADDKLRATLSVDPDGQSRDIGEELDLVLATRLAKGASLSLVIGRFEPGRAYPSGADSAWFGEVSFGLAF